jgi:hypothetical protein
MLALGSEWLDRSLGKSPRARSSLRRSDRALSRGPAGLYVARMTVPWHETNEATRYRRRRAQAEYEIRVLTWSRPENGALDGDPLVEDHAVQIYAVGIDLGSGGPTPTATAGW